MADAPPQDSSAEEAVLGAMMIAPAAIDTCIDILDPADFFRESHMLIYRRAARMHSEGRVVDAITLADELDISDELDKVGGRVRIHELAALVPASANVSHYARIVHDMSTLRGLVRAGGEISRLGWERPGEVGDLLEQAETLVAQIRFSRDRRREQTMTMYDAAVYLDEKFKNPPKEDHGVPTPWSFLPSMHGGRLYVLAGYTADGKTVQGVHFMRAAMGAAVKTDYVSLEMSKEDMAERVAANMGIPAKRVQSGHILDEHRDHAARVVGDLVKFGDLGTIIDAPTADIPMLRRLVKTRCPSFLIVDHLHQFHVSAQYERQDLEAIIRGLWQIAREFDIPVLLLAQMSKSQDKKNPFPRPTTALLKGTAAIEQLAWCVWFVWRERDEKNIATEKAEWIVAKNRSGPTGVRPLVFHDRETRFTEVVREG